MGLVYCITDTAIHVKKSENPGGALAPSYRVGNLRDQAGPSCEVSNLRHGQILWGHNAADTGRKQVPPLPQCRNASREPRRKGPSRVVASNLKNGTQIAC
jgi:hypothetical protein